MSTDPKDHDAARARRRALLEGAFGLTGDSPPVFAQAAEVADIVWEPRT